MGVKLGKEREDRGWRSRVLRFGLGIGKGKKKRVEFSVVVGL